MPIAMPSIERTERSRWPRSAPSASRSEVAHGSPPRERRDRVEPRGAPRRQHAEDDADGDRRARTRARHGPQRRRRRQRRVDRHERTAPPAQPSATPSRPPAAEISTASARKTREDLAAPGADGLQQPDLARALGHRDQHHVHDPDPGHRERDGGDAAERQRERAQDRANAEITASCVTTVTSSSPWRSLRSAHDRLPSRGSRSAWRAHLDQQPEQAGAVEHLHGASPPARSTTSSMSSPSCVPRGASTPITRMRQSPTRTTWPSGSVAGEELARDRGAEHGDRRRRGPRSLGGRKRPRAMPSRRTSSNSCVVPTTATCRRRSPMRHRLGAHRPSARPGAPRARRARPPRASSSVRSFGTPPKPGMAPVVSVLPGQHDEQVGAEARELRRPRSGARPRRAP